MAYSPKNSQVYFAAFAGAIAGINGTNVNDTTPADYVVLSQVADAFSQAVDTAWGVNAASSYDIACITDLISAYWSIRSASGASTNAATYTNPANAIVIAIRAGDTQAAAQGITPQGPATPAALVGNIIVDPQNSTGLATPSGKNQATVGGITGPCYDKWSSLMAAWGSMVVVISANTLVVFASSHTDNTDPVIGTFITTKGARFAIQGGPPTVVASGVVLAGTTAKNRTAGANSKLITTLGASGAIGQLIENTTHSSRAWAYKSLGGNSFEITQPMVKQTIGGTFAPAEVDTWVNGDSVNLLQPIQVNLSQLHLFSVDGGTFEIYQLNVFDPQGLGGSAGSILARAANVTMRETNCQQILVLDGSITSFAVNCIWQGGILPIGRWQFFGGATLLSALLDISPNTGIGASIMFDGDFIFGASSFIQASGGGDIDLGVVCLDQNIVFTTRVMCQNQFYGSHVVYGTIGNINMAGTARFALLAGTFVANFTAVNLVTGIQINGTAAASSHSNANNPDVINSNITTTPAHLDAAQGIAGFGGLAFSLGGGSVATVG